MLLQDPPSVLLLSRGPGQSLGTETFCEVRTVVPHHWEHPQPSILPGPHTLGVPARGLLWC